jgi:hypothetical protein
VTRLIPINIEFSKHAAMLHHVMPYHLSPVKNNSKNSRKIYYNLVRVINLSTCRLVTSPHVMSHFSIKK